jgi:hypothetical protein
MKFLAQYRVESTSLQFVTGVTQLHSIVWWGQSLPSRQNPRPLKSSIPDDALTVINQVRKSHSKLNRRAWVLEVTLPTYLSWNDTGFHDKISILSVLKWIESIPHSWLEWYY